MTCRMPNKSGSCRDLTRLKQRLCHLKRRLLVSLQRSIHRLAIYNRQLKQ